MAACQLMSAYGGFFQHQFNLIPARAGCNRQRPPRLQEPLHTSDSAWHKNSKEANKTMSHEDKANR
jgi:hypothetical protein